MTRLPRRLALLLALMFWQGGFLFYGAVVVPVGADVLGSHTAQGFVTRAVTNHLNAGGAAALAVWAWDLAAGTPEGRRLRWAGWGLLVLLLGVLAGLHPWLDGLLDAGAFRVRDRDAYGRLHQCYLIVSTVQWVAAVALTAATVRAWQREDAGGR